MKHFSKQWKSSSKPRKQRKYRKNAPLHIKKKFVSVNLAKELRTKYTRRNIPVRKGDTIKVLRGQYKKRSGKVSTVDKLRAVVFVEGIELTKRDGSKILLPLQPSNLQITDLNVEDRKRNLKVDKAGVKK